MKKRLAIVTTHPIQYNAPLFKLLTERNVIDLKVFYTWGNAPAKMFDKKFGILREWDIPLTEGYNLEMMHNYALIPDSNRFFGILNLGLRHKLRQWKPDAVLVYRWSVWSHFFLLAFFNLQNCKLFFRGDSILLESSFSIKFRILNIIKRFVFRKVNSALYVGARNRQYFEALGLNSDQLIFSPHCVDNDRFQLNQFSLEKRAYDKRLKMGISPNDIVFIYVGKFYEIKGLKSLILSFKKLSGCQYRLILIGGGNQELELMSIAKNDNRIQFISFVNQSEMPLMYRMGNVFVLPSTSETWGLSVNEAMACGLPAIISINCGCCSELIIEGETGFSFNGEEDLLNKMRLFNDLDKIKKMKENVKKHIANFNMKSLAISVEQLTCF